MQTVDEATDPALIQTYDRIREAQGAIGNLYRMLAHAPSMLENWIDFAWRLRFDVAADRGLRELAILRVAQLTQATYEWRAHWKAAVGVGVPEVKLQAIADWRGNDALSAEEQLILGVTDELTTTGSLVPTSLQRVVDAYGEQQAVELVLTIAFYSCVSRVLGGLGVPLEPEDPAVPSLPVAVLPA